ncbi:cytochrome P450 [Rhodococcus qingshengii]|uniref:cytochrome P450 n=1 Tax=Rhodococcus qingshengii TaxID=334542 RepID=UPI0021BAB1D2|nr:cytochrome P450 [Rhodococcus qingshengii]UXF66996.1 cytochrome P450 [Rhodococcus qingshengii]
MTSPVGSERAVHDTTDWLRTGLVDPTEPGFLSDPYARYAIAREVAPVQQHSNGVYMLFAYDDVKRALADKSLSSSEQYALEAPRNMRIKAAGGSDAYLLRPSLSKLDPPDHLALRKLLARPFTPRAIKRYDARAKEIVDELLADHGRGSEIELVTEVAHPLPIRLVCEIFGIPVPADTDTMFEWTRKGLNLLDPFLTAEQTSDYISAQRDFSAHLQDVIAWKRNNLGDDILSDFISAGDEGEIIGPDQVAATVQTLVIAGLDTTVNQVGLTMNALMGHRDQWERLVDDRALLDHAVEEVLRYEPTAQLMIRIAPEDYAVGDAVIPAGNHIVTWLASANRDETRFGSNADRLDWSRSNVRDHITFGHGAHACLGAWLARLEIKTILKALIDKAPKTELVDGGVTWGGTAFIRGVSELRLNLF